jgi:hypothetical protein
MPSYPSDDHLLVKAARFVNILDDERNILSPVKINVWAANTATASAGLVTILHWLGGHVGLIGDLWGPIGGWLTQAHTVHHFDKRERNLQEQRMK